MVRAAARAGNLIQNAVFAAFCAVGAGCVPFGDLSLVVIDARSDRSEDIVQQACDVWGLTCTTTEDEVGAIVVLLTDRPGNVEGTDTWLGGLATRRACIPRVWSTDSPYVLAHELGHVLGLDHVSHPANVMHQTAGRQVTDLQTERVRRHAQLLAACVGHDPIAN